MLDYLRDTTPRAADDESMPCMDGQWQWPWPAMAVVAGFSFGCTTAHHPQDQV